MRSCKPSYNKSTAILWQGGQDHPRIEGGNHQIGDRTDALENKFDDLVNYVQLLEEENSTLKHSQLQLQREDLENRERRQNLRFWGIPETVGDDKLRSYLLGLFNTLASTAVDYD